MKLNVIAYKLKISFKIILPSQRTSKSARATWVGSPNIRAKLILTLKFAGNYQMNLKEADGPLGMRATE